MCSWRPTDQHLQTLGATEGSPLGCAAPGSEVIGGIAHKLGNQGVINDTPQRQLTVKKETLEMLRKLNHPGIAVIIIICNPCVFCRHQEPDHDFSLPRQHAYLFISIYAYAPFPKTSRHRTKVPAAGTSTNLGGRELDRGAPISPGHHLLAPNRSMHCRSCS